MHVSHHLFVILGTAVLGWPHFSWSHSASPSTTSFRKSTVSPCAQALGHQNPLENTELRDTELIGRVVTMDSGRSAFVIRATGDNANRIDSRSGEAMITKLASFNDPMSPTTVRVEEKAVINGTDRDVFFRDTQSLAFARGAGLDKPITWEPRDVKVPGFNFETITEYGSAVRFRLNGAEVVMKPRYRQYFRVPADKGRSLPDSAESVFPDLVHFELKFASKGSDELDDFLGLKDAVFKPRILISTKIANDLRSLDGKSRDLRQRLEAIAREVRELRAQDGGRLLNSSTQVTSYFDALAELLRADPYALRVEYAVTYNRTSYKFASREGEYQFTEDRNIKVMAADPLIDADGVTQYLESHPLFSIDPETYFVELKSPTSEKRLGSKLYTALNSALTRGHLKGQYEVGRGKYSMAKGAAKNLRVTNYDNTLERGTHFWLVRGTANLPKIPDRKNVVDRREVQVAFPFKSRDGRTFRALFEYEPLNTLDGSSEGVLTRIRVVNDFGQTVKSQGDFADLIEIARASGARIARIEFDGRVIPFLVRISRAELIQYHAFIADFFANPSERDGTLRGIESLNEIHTTGDIKRLQFLFRARNFIEKFMVRVKRTAMTAAIVTVALATYESSSPALETVASSIRNFGSRVESATLRLDGFKDQNGVDVPLYVNQFDANSPVFYFPHGFTPNVTLGGEVRLYTSEHQGPPVIFDVMEKSPYGLYLRVAEDHHSNDEKAP